MQTLMPDNNTELNVNGNAMTDNEVLFTKFDFDYKQPVNNCAILETRFGFTLFRSHKEGALLVRDTKTGRTYGDLPVVALSVVWRKANRFLSHEKQQPNVSFDVWEEARLKLEAAITANRDNDSNKPVFVQDVWQIREIDFIELGICCANEIIELMRLSVLEDILETRSIDLFWCDIRRWYPHRVKTQLSAGGIFSDSDSRALEESPEKIRCLNDIRSKNIFKLKGLVPEHDFQDFPKQINRAYREDRARRRDFRYRVYPFIFGFIMLIVLIAISYQHQYTLLKNAEATTANIVLLSLWIVTILFIAFSVVRAAFRRKKKRPTYKYFTKQVKVSAAVFGALSLFAILSVTVFYERYDGYNDTFYYRNESENEIKIAGLVDEDVNRIIIPGYIDGKQVTGIDLLAFYRDEFTSVEIEAELSEIEYGAFLKCENLTSFDYGASKLTTVSKNVFKDCISLEHVELPGTVVNIESGAFKGCDELMSVSHSGGNIPVTIGEETFKNCISLENVGFLNSVVNIGRAAFRNTALTAIDLSNIEEIGRNAFADCENLEAVRLTFIGKDLDDLKNATYIFGNRCSVSDITLTECDRVYEGMFKGMDELVSVSFEKQVNIIEPNAFSGCQELEYVDLEGVTEIGNGAFEDCISLNISELPESVQVIGKNAFRNCDAIESLTIRGALTELGSGAFRDMDSCVNFDFSSALILDEIPDDLFRDCASLTSTNILDFVISVGDDAFRNCDSLSAIVVGSNIENLGRRIFKDCDSLEYASIAFSGADRDSLKPIKYLFGSNNNIKTLHIDEVDVINARTFSGMDNLETITFGNTISRIENGAFRNCESLLGIDLEGVTEIGDNAFRNCSQLAISELPDTLESIGKNAFRNCGSLQINELPTILKSIGQNAFRNCASINEIIFNRDLMSVGDYAFKGCSSLGSVDISGSALNTLSRGIFEDCGVLVTLNLGSKIDVIEARAFEGCASLTKLDIRSAEAIGRNAFKDCTNLSTVYVPFVGPDHDTPKRFNYAFKNSGVEHLEIEHMDSVPARAFRNIDSLISLTIHDDVEVIGNRAFEGNASLTTLNVNGVKIIKNRAFRNCESLANLSEFNELEEIGTNVFSGCNALTTIKISDKITHITSRMFKDSGFTEIILSPYTHTIDKYAFEDCSRLESIVIPSSVTEIAKGAFKGCINLRQIDLSGTNLETIETQTFENCMMLTEIKLPETVKIIKKRAFLNCSALLRINLENVSEIKARAFEWASQLTRVDLSKVETIDRNAFMDCYQLSEVTFSYELEKIGRNAFRDCESLQTLTVPSSVEKIGRRAFAECEDLTTLSVPFVGWSRGIAYRFRYLVGDYADVSVVQITDARKLAGSAFKNTDITEIYLNEDITKIGDNAFDGCNNLRTVYMSRQQQEFRYLFNEDDVEIIYYN